MCFSAGAEGLRVTGTPLPLLFTIPRGQHPLLPTAFPSPPQLRSPHLVILMTVINSNGLFSLETISKEQQSHNGTSCCQWAFPRSIGFSKETCPRPTALQWQDWYLPQILWAPVWILSTVPCIRKLRIGWITCFML